MNDFEYFSTISAFIAGLVLLVYLFKIRTIIIRKVKNQLLAAKASIHYISRPDDEEIDPWVDIQFRDLAPPPIKPAEFNGLFEEDTTWRVDTYRKKEIR